MAAPNGFVWGDAENQKILSAAKRANEAFGGVPAQISHTVHENKVLSDQNQKLNYVLHHRTGQNQTLIGSNKTLGGRVSNLNTNSSSRMIVLTTTNDIISTCRGDLPMHRTSWWSLEQRPSA
jgi:hypothetical protein